MNHIMFFARLMFNKELFLYIKHFHFTSEDTFPFLIFPLLQLLGKLFTHTAYNTSTRTDLLNSFSWLKMDFNVQILLCRLGCTDLPLLLADSAATYCTSYTTQSAI